MVRVPLVDPADLGLILLVPNFFSEILVVLSLFVSTFRPYIALVDSGLKTLIVLIK